MASYICALEINPDYAEAYSNLGGAYYDLERLDAAEANCRKALAIKHDLAEAHSNLGHVLMELGKIDEAERSLRMAISVAPGEARPISAALLHIPYRADDPDCNQLETVYARRGSLPLEDRIKLNFAMGKAMENIGQYDRSFSAYEEGNRFHYQGHPVDEAADMRFMDKSCGFFTEKLFNDFETLNAC
ncbi:MAG: tetratricopeptide repeat protein [Nitrosomonadales bacterium]